MKFRNMARWRRSQFFPFFIIIAVFFLFFSRSTPQPRLYDSGQKSGDIVNQKNTDPIPEPIAEVKEHPRDVTSKPKKEDTPKANEPKFKEDALKTAEIVDKVEGDLVKTFKVSTTEIPVTKSNSSKSTATEKPSTNETTARNLSKIFGPLDIQDGNKYPSLEDYIFMMSGRHFRNQAIKKAKLLNKVINDENLNFKDEEVVFVTYASDNHFQESREAIRRLRQITNATLIYYNLGLFPSQASELKKVCNVRVVNFDFERYPRFVSDLATYAFKPILMAEMYEQYPVFWVIDASARFFDAGNLAKFYDRVRSGDVEPFSAEHPTGHTIEMATHEQMYEYLPFPKEARKFGMRQALTMFVVRSPMAKEVIRWNLLCSLEEKCIAPRGASVSCGDYAGAGPICHRYDQSSMNIALCSYQLRHNRSCLQPNVTRGAYSDFATVQRESGYDGPLPTC